MGTDELYRREEDRKWREKVDHEQVTLMTGHQVLDRRMDELENKIDQLDRAVRGDPGEDRAGLLERLHEQETRISRLWAVIFMDASGSAGLFEEFKKLQRKESRSEIHWKFLTAVAVAVISTVGLLLSNWDRIKGLMPKHKPDRLEMMIERAKRPPKVVRRRRVTVVVPKETPVEDESTDEEMP